MKRYLYRNKGPSERGFSRAYSCELSALLITLCSHPDTLDEANIREGLISRSHIKQEMVLVVVSGWKDRETTAMLMVNCI